MRAAALGVWWALAGIAEGKAVAALLPVLRVTHTHPASLAAGLGQAFAVRSVLLPTFSPESLWVDTLDFVERVERDLGDGRVSGRLHGLTGHMNEFPLDLQDLCEGTSVAADQSWPFALAMFCRNPGLLEATLLSSINVGGDADTVGSMVGALLGARHGWQAFPEPWRTGLEEADRLLAEADALYEALTKG